MKRVYVCLGSNIGQRRENLETALERISSLPESQLLKVSSVYETPPWGYKNQPEFLNLVCIVQTSLSPKELLEELKKIERDMGRKPSFRYAPRIIDIDILLWEMEVIRIPELTVPHPKLHLRDFVLRPLSELNHDLIHPVLRKSVGELLEILEQSKSVPPKSANPGFHE